MNNSVFFIVGKHAVIEALKNPNRKVLRVILTEESKKTIHRENQNRNLLKNIKVFFKTKKELDNYCKNDGMQHQGFVAEIEHLQKLELKEFIKLFELTKKRAIKSIKIKENEIYYEIVKSEAIEKERAKDYDAAVKTWEKLGAYDEVLRVRKVVARERESARDYDSAIKIWEELGEIEEAARVRKLKAEEGSVKVSQKVVHGDEVTKTEIKDSVLNRSNVGGGSSKAEELREAKSLFEEGLIDDDEFKQMKKEILGK